MVIYSFYWLDPTETPLFGGTMPWDHLPNAGDLVYYKPRRLWFKVVRREFDYNISRVIILVEPSER